MSIVRTAVNIYCFHCTREQLQSFQNPNQLLMKRGYKKAKESKAQRNRLNEIVPVADVSPTAEKIK